MYTSSSQPHHLCDDMPTALPLPARSRVIFYAVVTAVVAMDRVSLKKSVIDASEVLTGIGQIPHLEAYLNSLYACKYASFFAAFVEVVDLMRADPYLSLHLRYYMREVRVVAYAQFLESYKSVTLESMAAAFDVPPGFLDAEVADFIVAGRLNAKIDKVRRHGRVGWGLGQAFWTRDGSERRTMCVRGGGDMLQGGCVRRSIRRCV
eukprot:364631-Chlamydomonas_euryale.AAC.31